MQEKSRRITVEKSVSEKANLCIDVGNTSIKSALFDPNAPGIVHISRYRDVSELITPIQSAGRVYLSNVGKDNVTSLIQSICADNNVQLFIAETQKSAFGLKNSYSTPSNMGVDRWLAMLACMHKSQSKTFLVVDIGTAMTVDAVQNGIHLGGWIVPGLSLLKQSLFKNTQRVFGTEENFGLTDFGKDTPLCVDHGCTAQILGTLLMAEREMKKNVKKFEIFLTGGDKKLFLNLDVKNIIPCENLVLEGLTLFVD